MTARNALVTGATRGLGLAIARRLAAEGFGVIGTGRKLTPELDELLGAEWPSGGSVRYRALDLSGARGLHSFVHDLTAECGPLYALVNNAAVGYDGVLATMHETQIAELLSVNLTSAILLTKYAVRSMLVARDGRIVNIASIIASTGFNGLSVYAASKAGLIGFTRSLARELGRAGITVNCVAPGYMETDMTAGLAGEKLESIRRRTPGGKLARPADAAAAVAFLLGEDARAITGTTLTVDAGSTA